jgi:hypothetical protein
VVSTKRFNTAGVQKLEFFKMSQARLGPQGCSPKGVPPMGAPQRVLQGGPPWGVQRGFFKAVSERGFPKGSSAMEVHHGVPRRGVL